MKLVKSLLLGSAAGLFAVAGAQAADLPVRKAAPVVDYVRVCSAYGTGFFFIPGTETCLRVSGRVRAEYAVSETYRRDIDTTFNWRARGQLNLDARTQTAYGTLRTFIRYELTRNIGSVYGNGAGVLSSGNPGTNSFVDLNKAFIQFAGITAGRATSFFDFYATAILWGPNGGSDTDANLLAYTASFGSGISASISLEDPTARRTNASGVATNALGAPIGFVYDNDLRPHIVGQLRIEQAWGTAQLSGAAFQIRSGNVFVPAGSVAVNGVFPATVARLDRGDTEYGFAIQGGLKINLPMLAAGDQLWLQAAYSNGNASYLGTPGAGFGGFSIGGSRDAFIDPLTGDIERAKGFSLTAAFLHYWTPQIRQGLYANWRQIDVPGAATAGFATTGFGAGEGVFASGALVDFNRYELGTNLIWSPVAGLDIGVEVLYQKVAAKNGRIQVLEPRFPGDAAASFTTVGTRRSEDNYQARLRIQRDF